MKLFAKYNRINLLVTVLIFLLASVAFSFLLRYVVINQIDEDLKIEKNEVLSYIDKYGALPSVIEVHDQYTTYQKVDELPSDIDRIITKRTSHDHHHNAYVRTILFGTSVDGQLYVVTVSKSLEGTEDLIQSIIAITVATIILILITTLFINRLLLRRLWQPFYETLHSIQKFKLSNTAAVSFPSTRIDEFNMLNSTLSQTINKAQQDYLVLKEFTENASHEMQTPLAIIRSKLDLLIQNEDLTEAQSNTLQGSYEAIKSMKKLNESLLLLAKIENQQFSETTLLNLEEIVKSKQRQFAEQWQSMQLHVLVNAMPAFIKGNHQLIDILLNNLLSNATRHNTVDGCIHINLQPQTLGILNSGEAITLDENNIFSRFYKGNSSTGKHGLGLAIVWQICEVSGYTIQYTFKQPNIHSFILNWE